MHLRSLIVPFLALAMIGLWLGGGLPAGLLAAHRGWFIAGIWLLFALAVVVVLRAALAARRNATSQPRRDRS